LGWASRKELEAFRQHFEDHRWSSAYFFPRLSRSFGVEAYGSGNRSDMSPQVPKAGPGEEVFPGEPQHHAPHDGYLRSEDRAAAHTQKAIGAWAQLVIEEQSHIRVCGNAAPRGAGLS
jgi:hypothetical protein